MHYHHYGHHQIQFLLRKYENVSSECGTEGVVKGKVGVLISGTGKAENLYVS